MRNTEQKEKRFNTLKCHKKSLHHTNDQRRQRMFDNNQIGIYPFKENMVDLACHTEHHYLKMPL